MKSVDPFHAPGLFLHPLKTSEKKKRGKETRKKPEVWMRLKNQKLIFLAMLSLTAIFFGGVPMRLDVIWNILILTYHGFTLQ